MKLSLTLNTINLIFTGIISVGVVGVATMTIVNNGCLESENPEIKQAGGAVTWPGESLPCGEEECEVIWPTEDDDFELNEGAPVDKIENIPAKQPGAGNQNTSASSNTNKPGANQTQAPAQRPATSKPVETTKPAEPTYSTYNEYQKTIMGTCPSQRKTNDWERGDRLAAVGISMEWLSRFTYKTDIVGDINLTAEFYVLNSWDYYARGSYTSTESYTPLYFVGYPKDDRYYRTQFITHLDTLTVEAEGTMANDSAVQKHAQQLTKLLRDTVSKYRQKCPNN